jgi:F-type H+-transporting ATPase subunit b
MIILSFLLNFVEFNKNILETNLINILILLSLIIYVGKGFIKNSVEERKQIILKNLENLNNNLSQANSRFIESLKQLKQIHLILKQLQEENKNQKIISLEKFYKITLNEINFIFDSFLKDVEKNKAQSLQSLQKFLITFVFGKVLLKFQNLTIDQKKELFDIVIKDLRKNWGTQINE